MTQANVSYGPETCAYCEGKVSSVPANAGRVMVTGEYKSHSQLKSVSTARERAKGPPIDATSVGDWLGAGGSPGVARRRVPLAAVRLDGVCGPHVYSWTKVATDSSACVKFWSELGIDTSE